MPKIKFIQKIRALLSASERKSALILFMLMIIGMVLETLGIGLVIPVVGFISDPSLVTSDTAIKPLIEFFNIDSQKSLIKVAVVGLVLVYVLKNVFLAFFAWYKIHFTSNLRMKLSNRLFSLYLSQPYTFHLQRNSGQLIQNVATEVTIFTGRLLGPLMVLCTEVLVMSGLALLLFTVEPAGALIVLVTLGAIGGGLHYFTRLHITRWGKQRQFHEGKRIQHLQQGLGGVKDVIFLGREDNFLEQYEYHNQLSTRPDQLQATLQEIPRLWFEVLAVTGLMIIIFVMLAQEREMSAVFATLGVFAAAAFRLMPSITRILAAIQSLRYSMPVLDTLSTEFKLAKLKLPMDNALDPIDDNVMLNQSLVFCNINFTYPGALKASITNISFEICKGESVGIIGSSGAGKSTLVDVLLGLLTPNSGQVLVDGVEIHEHIRAWQNQIGYVPQSIFLTDDTLRNNIAFGVPQEKINEEAVYTAVRAAQLDKFVEGLPDGLDTVVGERGVRLSGGQRQRIGIARALYYDPEVLVLDEATSSLDSETEADVMRTVQDLQGNKTIIIVAHRLSTVEKCDRLYRLEAGEIIEEGKPEKLLANR